MTSLQKASWRIVRSCAGPVKGNALSRGYRSSTQALAAQNFKMPAMSPTMTEGNIANWKVKEGDSFSTGDVLLEIETDKAQMDVEAQEDGKLAKITQEAGAKGVTVGTRIAVIAESDDDLSTISLPADEPTASPPSAQEAPKPSPEASRSEKQAPSKSSSESTTPPKTQSKPQKQTYPLFPSIIQLLHENNLPTSEADKIPASGPKGRLLKGDVLAYIGQISQSYSSEQSGRITKLGHLDLSNIQVAAPAKPTPPPTPTSKPIPEVSEPAAPAKTEVAVPISLSAVIAVQKRIQDTLGISLPLSMFLARATELANEDLPRFGNAKPSADELFNDVLGLTSVDSRVSRGQYIPQITALPPTTSSATRSSQPKPSNKTAKGDIYDILTSSSSSAVRNLPSLIPLPQGIMAGSKPGEATNLFSVSVAAGEEKRGRTFLERVKTILQVEPGRLIL